MAFHPDELRGFHGRWSGGTRTAARKKMGVGEKHVIAKPMSAKSRVLKQQATYHHNTLLMKKRVLNDGVHPSMTQMHARYHKTRMSYKAFGMREDRRLAARLALIDYAGSSIPAAHSLSWLKARR